MKKSLLAILAMIIALPLFSIDTLTIELDEYGNNYDLKAQIDADQGAHVYKLLRNGYYYVDGTIENTFPIVLVGEEGPENLAPATLLYKTDDQGESPNEMFQAKDDITFKNLYLVGVDDLGAYRNFYTTSEPEVKLVVENCVCNYTNNWKGFFEFKSVEGTVIMRNNMVMNMMRQDGYVWATWLHTQNTKPDTMIITNNTIFNCPNNMLSLNERDGISPNYAEVNHNTVVNTAKDILHFSYWLNLHHKNNLYHNVMYQGDSEFSATGWTHRVQCPDDEPYAFIKVDTIPNADWEDSMLNAIGIDHRVMNVFNNNFYQSDLVKSIPGMVGQHLVDTAASVYRDSGNIIGLMSPRTQAMFDDDAAYPGLYAMKNWQQDPGLTNDPTNPDDLVAHALMLYRNTTPGVNTHFDLDKDSNPDGYQMTYEWPIWGEGGYIDFTYSNTSLMGADGLHLGDLYHWYPNEYAQWVSGTVGVEETSRTVSQLQVYPNPASDMIRLSKVSDVSIYNLNGQLVKSVYRTDIVDISDMVNGLYFVKDVEGNVVKLIVK